MPASERLGPYLEQLLDNEDVQADVRRAVARAEQAFARARSRRSARQAVEDPGVQQRLRQSVAAAWAAATTIARGPEIERAKQLRRRRQRRNRLLGVTALTGAAYAAYKASAPSGKEQADV